MMRTREIKPILGFILTHLSVPWKSHVPYIIIRLLYVLKI